MSKNGIFTILLIGMLAITGCATAQGITLPKDLTEIGEEAFKNCPLFEGYLAIPECVTKIGERAFQNCTGIIAVELGEKVESVGDEAFSGCTSLTRITVNGMETAFADKAFDESGATLTLLVYKNSEAAKWAALHGVRCEYIEEQIDPGLIPPEGETFYENGESGTFWYISYGDGTVGITEFTQYESARNTNLVIPSKTRDGLRVTAIEDEAFVSYPSEWNRPLFTGDLIIPEGIVRIGESAFAYCYGFTGNLVLPSTLREINDSAFAHCAFTGNLVLPEALREIGSFAFDGRSFYDSSIGEYESYHSFTGPLAIPVGVSAIGEGAFTSQTGFTGDLILPVGLKTIGAYAFQGCDGLKGRLQLSDGLIEIGDSAFYGCEFTGNLIFPESIKTIGENAFGAYLDTGEYPYKYVSSFSGQLVIPDGVTSIGARAFEGQQGFTGDLILPNTLTEIGEYAFYKCNGFTGNLVLPDSLTEIGNYAFSNCNGFTGSIRLPQSIRKISSYAFENCKFTGELTLPDTLEYIGERAFWNAQFSGELVIPPRMTFLNGFGRDRLAAGSCFSGTLNIPETVTGISSEAFEYMNGFEKVIIPGSVKYIGILAFYGCSFTELVLGEGIEEIDVQAFSGCKSLKELWLPSSIKTISNYSFADCGGIKGDLFIPEGIERIEYGAFNNCTSLRGVLYLPSSLKYIGDYAFENTPLTLASQVLPDGLEYLGSLPHYVDLWLPASLSGISNRVLEQLKSGSVVMAPIGSTAADLLLDGGVDYRASSSSKLLPEGKLYQGDYFNLSVGPLIAVAAYKSIRASIYSGETCVRNVESTLEEPAYEVNAYLKDELHFETLPAGSYRFVLEAVVDGSVRTLAETSFSVAIPSLRLRARDLHFPQGICTDSNLTISGTLVCNAPMTSLTLKVTHDEAQSGLELNETIAIPDEQKHEADLAELIDPALLRAIPTGKYKIRLTVAIPSKDVEGVVIDNRAFQHAALDGTVDEQTVKKVYAFALNGDNVQIFNQFREWNTDIVNSLDWKDVLKMAWQGRYELFDQEVFEGGSDSYMLSFCKQQILVMLDDIARRERQQYNSKIDQLQKDMLSYIGKGTKQINDYADQKGIYVGTNKVTLTAEDKKILGNIEKIGTEAGKIKSTVEDIDAFEEGVYNLMTYLAADYSVELSILDSVLASMSSNNKVARHAMAEIRAEFRNTAFYIINNTTKYLKDRGEDYIRGLVLKEVSPQQVFFDKISDKIMEETGWEEDAQDDMSFLAWDDTCSAALNAYRNAFIRVAGGDTSGEAITSLRLTFQFAKESFAGALEASESIAEEKFGTTLDVKAMQSKLAKLKID